MTVPTLTAVERLNLSRARLRQAMTRPESKAGDGSTSGNRAMGQGILDVLKIAVPSAGLVIDAIEQWWAGHPLQASGSLVEGVVDELLRPWAKRHPLTLVAGAVAAGALLVWSRPWRWALKPHLLNTWGPAVLSSAIASSAVQSWLLGVLAKTSMQPAQATTPTPATPSTSAPAPGAG